MNFVDDPMLIVAVLDLGVALECLRFLFEVPKGERSVRWAHEVCTYSRYIHINIWADRPSIDYIEREITGKLLKDAVRQVEGLRKLKRFNDVEKDELLHFHTNIELRLQNLEKNFLKGQPSDFDPAEEEPANHMNRPT